MKRKHSQSSEITDLKNINVGLEKLSHEKLMYVAGAVAALSAASNSSASKDPPEKDSA